MRALIQRVKEAEVRVGERVVGRIGPGLVVLLGVARGDGEKDARWLAQKVAHLRVFDNEAGRMAHSLLEKGLAVLVVSQFTLYGDCRHGRRPDFNAAAPTEQALPQYRSF
ncbi:MAG: D-tyrosyl-tRNA(Tyr) deacylase, partial [Firmicutes bacterium]|nr:D-tyrosyl-tRNA(Tyr) deacylase [Bacillota bacterium]